jgi:hypothetical protein
VVARGSIAGVLQSFRTEADKSLSRGTAGALRSNLGLEVLGLTWLDMANSKVGWGDA